MIHKLEADSINLEYGARKILSDVYIKMETGKITGLLGRNGTGKTSLMNIIYGSLNARSKSIRFDDNHISCAYKEPELISFLPQFNYIPAFFTVKRVFSDFTADYSSFQEHFPEFKSSYNKRISSLSGGQRRLVELYLVLTSKSKFSLLDEPFSHLTPVLIEQVKDFIKQGRNNKGLLITDHMFQQVIDITDDLYLLTDGNSRIVKDLKDLEFFCYVNQVSLT